MRGNIFSRNHTYLNPRARNDSFWDFSFQDVGECDVPAQVNYITAHTGK